MRNADRICEKWCRWSFDVSFFSLVFTTGVGETHIPVSCHKKNHEINGMECE